MKRLSYDHVYSFFEENGCKLLSTEYINNTQILEFICKCGNKSTTTFSNFKKGKRCRDCKYNKISKSLSFDYEFVKKYFEDNDCILLEKEYINANTQMEYICECGNKSLITFSNFKSGKRCRKCGAKKTANKNRRTIEQVREIFEKEKCTLLTNKYINNKQLLDYICICGNKHSASLDVFLSGCRCPKCKINKLRHSYEFVYNYFKEQGCLLVSTEYSRSDQILDYICKCGRLSKTQFSRFQNGQRCMRCRDEKFNIGENSIRWNGGITNISNYVRCKMTNWKKSTEESCHYRCIFTESPIYDVHHIIGFNTIFKEVIDKLNIEIKINVNEYSKETLELLVKETEKLHIYYGLGICLSEEIHYDFHKKYGFSKNNKEQFLDYVNKYYPDKYEKVIEIV